MKRSPYLHDAIVLLVGEMLLGMRSSIAPEEAETIAVHLAAEADLDVLREYARGRAS